MAFKFFIVPMNDAGQGEAAMNAFLRSNHILKVEKQWVEQGTNSFWSFCVDYRDAISGAPTIAPSPKPSGAKTEKVDYKLLLTPDEFNVYLQLRNVRQEIADKEKVVLFAVVNNQQIYQLVKNRVTSKAAMLKIPGIGEARAEKYGAKLLEVLTAWKPIDEATNSAA